MEQVYIKDKEGNKVLPITSDKAVRDKNGNPLDSRLNEIKDALDARYTKQETYSKNELNSLITTPNQKYVTVKDYASLPATGEADTIYRVSNWDGSLATPAADITKYSEYAWDGTQYVFLSVKSQIGEVYDISAANGNDTYIDLNDALTNGGVPSSLRKGGMSIKFVQSSDNNYVQYRYMLEDATTNSKFVNAANWQGVDDEPTAESKNLVESGGVAKKCALLDDSDDEFSIGDEKGMIIVAISDSFFAISNKFKLSLSSATEGDILKYSNGIWVAAPNITSISDLVDVSSVEDGDLLKYENGEWVVFSGFNIGDSDDEFSIEDEKNVKALFITGNQFGIGKELFDVSNKSEGCAFIYKNSKWQAIKINADWYGKSLGTYGDSITAINNGDYTRPYTLNENTPWGNYVANYYDFAKQYGRGIGGQTFRWENGGGAVSFVTPTGVLINRLDNYNYDTWNALSTKVYPSGVTEQMISDGDAFVTRGCGCSWLRITSQFPPEIKDSINCIFIQFHNDLNTDINDDALWVTNDTTDAEWAASSYYSTYGGDYNIGKTKGAIASLIMKMQAWMPQAVLILGTPISGRGTQGEMNKGLTSPEMQGLSQMVKDMGQLMSIPVVDVYATDGINGLNRTSYISDSIHPYTAAGKKAVARAVIGGIKTIMPNF